MPDYADQRRTVPDDLLAVTIGGERRMGLFRHSTLPGRIMQYDGTYSPNALLYWLITAFNRSHPRRTATLFYRSWTIEEASLDFEAEG